MALRIGKKKAAATEDLAATEDFSDFGEASPTNPATVTATPVDPDFDFGASTTPFDTTVASTETTGRLSLGKDYVAAVPVEEAPIVAPPKKRVPLPALLGLGALGLLGLGALAWSRLAPAEETEEAPIIARRPPVKPAPPKAPPAQVIVVKGAPVKPTTKIAARPPLVKTAATKTVTTQTTAKTVTGAPPGAATTTTTQTTVATALLPNPQAAAAAIANGPRLAVPVDLPAPVVFPPPAARPGKWANPDEVTVAQGARIAPPVAPAVKARLKALWKQGADAKHRKDYAGARRAWNQALKLAPGYPGFADSIAKLPR